MAVKAGMDVFRVFDALNYLPNLMVGVDAVGKAGESVRITYHDIHRGIFIPHLIGFVFEDCRKELTTLDDVWAVHR